MYQYVFIVFYHILKRPKFSRVLPILFQRTDLRECTRSRRNDTLDI